MHRRPPPRPTIAAALILGWVCLMIAISGPRPWDLRHGLILLAAAGAAAATVAVVRRVERRHGIARWEAMWRHRRSPACMYFVMAIVAMLAMVTMTGRSGGSVLVRLIAMPVPFGIFLGAAIGALGVVRVSGGRYCWKCRYEMSDAIAADPGCDRCPECGTLWKAPGGTVGDRVTYHWPWIVAGIIVGATLTIGPMRIMSRPALRVASLQFLPTNSLIEEAAVGRSFTSADAWNALMARQLTPEQERRLTGRLLDGRSDRGYLATVADDWVQGRLADGMLPHELAHRYIDEHPHPHILEARKILAAPRPAAAAATAPGDPSGPP